MGKLLIWALENILPPSITGLVVEKTLGYQVDAPDEILWATRAERPLLGAGVTAIDYITTTRDLRGSQYDLSCVTVGGGTPSIRYGATPQLLPRL